MIKILIALVVIACLAPLVIPGPDGRPLMSLDDFIDDWTGGVELPDAPESTPSSGPVTVYKWQDEEGNWHFSDTPIDQAGAERFEVDGVVNTMPAVTLPAKTETTASAASPQPVMPTSANPQELMDAARQIQATMDQRNADLEQLTGQQ